MENIEEKLQNYRLRKKRHEKINQFKETIKCFLMLGVKHKNDNEHSDKSTLVVHDDDNVLPQSNSEGNEEHGNDGDNLLLSSEEDPVENAIANPSFDRESHVLQYTLRVVYIAFWITLYVIAIELQFGIVFLMFSALAAIYLNTRTGPKKQNEVSAYSVFNKNCESIDGTLKAEQFEREIGIR